MPRYADQPPHVVSRLRQSPSQGPYRYVRARWHIVFAILDLVGGLLWALPRLAKRCRVLGKQTAETPGVRRLLIVQLDHLGDALMSTAMLTPLRRSYPTAEIHVLASPRSAAVFCESAEVDRVHVWDGYRFDGRPWWQWTPGLVATALRMWTWRFDLGFDVRGELPLAALLWLSGVRRRVGWACGGGGFLLTANAPFVAGRPELESRRELLLAAGVAVNGRLQTTWPLEPTAKRCIAERLNAVGHGAGPLLVIHTGAGTAAKRWPVEHSRQLIARLLLDRNGDDRPTLILVGGEADRGRSAHAALGLKSDRLHNWTGELSLPQLAALCAQATLFIGADSGPAHLAAAVGAPVLALFSGANLAEQWRPTGQRVAILRHPVACGPCHRQECPWSDHPCMSGISPAQVLSTVRSMLADSDLAALSASRRDGSDWTGPFDDRDPRFTILARVES